MGQLNPIKRHVGQGVSGRELDNSLEQTFVELQLQYAADLPESVGATAAWDSRGRYRTGARPDLLYL